MVWLPHVIVYEVRTIGRVVTSVMPKDGTKSRSFGMEGIKIARWHARKGMPNCRLDDGEQAGLQHKSIFVN